MCSHYFIEIATSNNTNINNNKDEKSKNNLLLELAHGKYDSI